MLRLRETRTNPGRWSYEKIIIPWLDKLDDFYVNSLKWSLTHKKVIIIVSVAVLGVSIFFSYQVANGIYAAD